MTRSGYIAAAAEDFARHIKGGGGWALGLEVAACVMHGTAGRPAGNRNDRNDSGKVSASEFARLTGTSAPRVLRYLDAWKRAAERGLVRHTVELTPADWNDPDHLPTGYAWDEFYTSADGTARTITDEQRRELLTTAANEAGIGVTKVLDVASNPNAVAVAMSADPDFAARVIRQTDPDALGEAVVSHEPAERATGRARGRKLPQPPSDTPPSPYPGYEADAAWIDSGRDIVHLHEAIRRVRTSITEHPDVWRRPERFERLERLADAMAGLVQLAQGISDDDLAALLDGAS